ncbi:MAG: AI-2E family transporter [Spirochaetaceae bacterium]|jgi:predicted PurR-regulated permease PerM|nr:AI-2E family transporter [Spirochaetaceae bacterium]
MNTLLPGENYGKGIMLMMAFIVLIVAGVVLKLTASVAVLLIISIFLACVMSPVVSALERLHINRLFSIILAGCAIIAALTLTGIVLYTAGRTILNRWMLYERRLIEIYRWLGAFFEFSYNENLNFLDNLWAQLAIRNNVRQLAISFSNGLITFLKNAFMVVLFIVFLLVEAASLKTKIALAFENKLSLQIRKISSDVAREVTRYLSVKFFISLATGIAVIIPLQIIGLEFALVWGVIQFILNFIPIIGSVAVSVTALLFAVLQFWPEPAPIIAVGGIMLGANMLIGTILEPRIMGYNLGISPIVILLALLLWGWLWGFAGMVLAVPLTVIFKIICENIPQLEPLSILLGSKKAAQALQ